MKKVLLFALLPVAVLAFILYLINPPGIYQLSAKTTQFIPRQAVPTGLLSLKAADCGVCHVDIYREWRTSLHAQAFTDPFFTAYHRKDKGDPTCLICHTPLQNQSPVLLTAGAERYADLKVSPNPDFDAELQQEGVTCAACHVRDGVIYGPYPAEDMNAPHPVAFDEKFLSHTLCSQCHEVPSKNFSLMREGICSTGMEFSGGHWAERGFICQNCHMEAIERPLMAGFPTRTGRRHLWPGGYSATQLRRVFTFRAEAQSNDMIVTITNSGAGHRAPTGDPDRFIVLDFYWLDEQGNRTELDSIEFKRRIIWQPIMFVLTDNRLGPGESLQLTLTPPGHRGALHVDGTYHVMTEGQRQRLRDKFGLTDESPIRRRFLQGARIDIGTATAAPLTGG